MGVGGGIHDEAVDVTYSTKPDNPQVAFGQGALLPPPLPLPQLHQPLNMVLVLVLKKILEWA